MLQSGVQGSLSDSQLPRAMYTRGNAGPPSAGAKERSAKRMPRISLTTSLDMLRCGVRSSSSRECISIREGRRIKGIENVLGVPNLSIAARNRWYEETLP